MYAQDLECIVKRRVTRTQFGVDNDILLIGINTGVLDKALRHGAGTFLVGNNIQTVAVKDGFLLHHCGKHPGTDNGDTCYANDDGYAVIGPDVVQFFF